MKRLAKLLLLILLATAPAFAGTPCGYPFIGGTSNTVGDKAFAMTPCTPVYDSTVNFAAIYTVTASANKMIVSVYDSDGPSGKPGTRLCQNITGISSTAATTWNHIDLSGSSCPTLLKNHTVWLVEDAAGSSGAVLAYNSSGGSGWYYSLPCCSGFDSTFNASPSQLTDISSAYLDITPINTIVDSGNLLLGVNLNRTNYVYATPVIPAQDSTVNKLYFYTTTGVAAQVIAAVYDGNGTGLMPGTLLCANLTGISSTATATWNSIDMSGSSCPTLTRGHKYWAVINSPNINLQVGNASNGYFYTKTCCTSFDSTFSAAATQYYYMAAYLELTQTGSELHCGNEYIGPNINNINNDEFAGATCTPAVDVTVNGLSTNASTYRAAKTVAAIYDSDGGSGKPGTLICSNSTGIPDHELNLWNFIPLSGCGTLTHGHTYWAVIMAVGYLDVWYTGTGPSFTTYYYSKTPPTFDSTFSGSPTSQGSIEPIYLNVTELAPVPKHQAIVATENMFLPPYGTGPTPLMGLSPTRAMVAGYMVESAAKANIDGLITYGLLAAGYNWVVGTDADWMGSRDGTTNIIAENLTGYPSGIASLVAYAHAKGPTVRYMHYLESGTGGGCFLGTLPTSGGYEAIDANQTVNTFGADGLKYDACGTFSGDLNVQTGYATMSLALVANRTPGKAIYFDASEANKNYGTPWVSTEGSVGANDVWTSPDAGSTTWTILTTEIDAQYGYESYARPGRFNMIDLMEVGNGTLTDAEGRAEMALFSALSSPLLWAADLTGSAPSSATQATVKNAAVIAADQDIPSGCFATGSCQGKRVSRTACGSANCECYAKKLSSSKWFIVGWNRASTSQTVTCTFADFGGGSSYTGYDDWAGSSLGTLTTNYAATVASHDAFAVTLTP